MKITTLELSPLGTNCYIVFNSDGDAVVIDPADDWNKIFQTAEGKSKENFDLENAERSDVTYRIKKILLTHGHFDHTGAALRLHKETDAPIYIHEADKCMLTDGDKAFAYFLPGKKYAEFSDDELASLKLIKDGDVITQGDLSFTVMSTPGHSAGSVCYLCRDEKLGNVMFAGDTIFKDSIGRSDGYSGDCFVQQESLEKLKALTEDYLILPGHGPKTTLNAEKRYNPFLAGLDF